MRVLQVAWREFASTVLTKSFIIGVLITPVVLVVVIAAVAATKNLKGPQVSGRLALLDRSGAVAAGVVERFSEEGAAAEKAETQRTVEQALDQTMGSMPLDAQQKAMARGMVGSEVDKAMARIGRLSVDVLAPALDDDGVQRIKDRLAQTDVHGAAKNPDGPEPTIGLIVVPREAVVPGPGAPFAEFQSFWPDKLDFEIRERIHRRIGDAIVDARIAADPRVAASGLAPAEIRRLIQRPGATDRVVTSAGERSSAGPLQMMVPAGFMLLLMMAVMFSGQMLLTTTIEEKGSRVMEVLLSAVSPFQLMLGKILGQMSAGLLMLVIYSGMGIGALVVFSLGYLVSPLSLVYLVCFFFIAYFIIGSMFAAIGSAVTELREAQTLMTPLTLVIITPWLLWLPLSRAPNSTFAQVLSFVPAVNPFVMVIRLTSSEPPPTWQTLAAIAVGVATAAFCAWFSAKIFRVGVLMYGKPPNLRTLVKWVRMA